MKGCRRTVRVLTLAGAAIALVAGPAAWVQEASAPPKLRMTPTPSGLRIHAERVPPRQLLLAIAEQLGIALFADQGLPAPGPADIGEQARESAAAGDETSHAGDLAAALGSGDPIEREEAVYALGALGGMNALLALRQALDDRDAGVREAAADMLDLAPWEER